jgi:hypothetical protein
MGKPLTFLQMFLPYNEGMSAREQDAFLREDMLLLVSLHNVLLLQALQGVGSIPAILVLQITKQKLIFIYRRSILRTFNISVDF